MTSDAGSEPRNGDTAPPRLLTNAAWNLCAFLIAIAANFLTIPLVIKAIGISRLL